MMFKHRLFWIVLLEFFQTSSLRLIKKNRFVIVVRGPVFSLVFVDVILLRLVILFFFPQCFSTISKMIANKSDFMNFIAIKIHFGRFLICIMLRIHRDERTSNINAVWACDTSTSAKMNF